MPLYWLYGEVVVQRRGSRFYEIQDKVILICAGYRIMDRM
ncbi:hypothetical protein LEP1GSC188_3466 [Leptospira weilii serovar Topaz str. LT2116]|uniref:Uncharacterized protein n=1 Tax=Leptospira weilii serovar Topaz str. LT2116 TaxID=1088540 RepID=M3EIV0_9LEPT|nr:hypothetical protein LEP1GSC188_3466 [Leptospira weilii serovar Topaz str. LT2116]